MPNFLEETGIFHLRGGSDTPTLEINETIAGTGASGGIAGSDEAGLIALQIGSSPSSGGSIFTLEFSKPYSFADAAPFLVLSPANEPAAMVSGRIYADFEASGNSYIQFNLIGASLDEFQTYEWVYHVTGRRG